LEKKGTTLIAGCAPSNPTVDLTTAIGEGVSEGIPHALGDAVEGFAKMTPRRRLKAGSEEYLNAQFGWRPLLNDLKSFGQRIINGDAAYKQFERDSGKLVRRRNSFPPETEKKTTVFANAVSPYYSPSSSTLDDGLASEGQVIREEVTTRKVWFSGAFTYYVPPRSNDQTDDMARGFIWARKSLGLGFSPDAVWNLLPWSWAVDWFSSTGDVLKNLDSWILYNQVLAYGYVMEEVSTTFTYTFIGPTGFKSQAIPSVVVLTRESKTRIKATPYGFGLTWDGLSTFQKSIIAALGLNRGSGKH
jgi:hypothetical protein